MNVNSKREKLKKMCLEFGDYCQGCPLVDVDENCNIDNASESTIEQYYRIAFGNEDKLNFTKSQIENLITFIDCNFLREIREDDTVDDMDYICDICEIYRKLQKLSKSDSNSQETD